MKPSVTPVELQQEIVDIIRGLFEHETLNDSTGADRRVSVHMQDLPYKEIRTEEDDDRPEPYVIVRLADSSTAEPGAHPTIRFLVVCCVFDEEPNRQGYRDAVHLMNKIFLRFVEDGVVGNSNLIYPVNWTTQEDDTHPYYFTGVELVFESTGYFVKEMPELW